MESLIMPLSDRILVEKEEAKPRESGIVIPESVQEQEKQSIGLVISAGPGRYSESGEFIGTSLEPGMRVIFNRNAGTELALNGKKYQLIREMDILARLLDEAT